MIHCVSDLKATQRRLERVGAIIGRPVFSFSGGHRFHFLDRDGYELAVWPKQADAH